MKRNFQLRDTVEYRHPVDGFVLGIIVEFGADRKSAIIRRVDNGQQIGVSLSNCK